MKRWFFSLTVIGLVIFISPGAIGEVYMDYDFSGGCVWQVDGFEVYDIMQRGEIVGQGRIDYSDLEMMDSDAFRVEWTQSWTSPDGEVSSIDVDVKQRASDLKAYMSTRIETIGAQEWRFEGNYTGGSLDFSSYFPGETERREASLNRTGRFHDADVLPFLLRNIIFEDGNFVTLTVVDVGVHSFITPIASVRGSEIVETANTQYDCWIVSVSMGTRGFTAWYSKNEKHYLVRIRYSDRDVVLNHHS